MKYLVGLFIAIFSLGMVNAQTSKEARTLLNEVKAKVQSYKNQKITFDNEIEIPSADPDKKSIKRSKTGVIVLSGDSYRLELDGLVYIYDSKYLYIIDPDIEEVDITTLDEDVPLSPTAILNEFDNGYSLKMGETNTINGKKIQFVNLKPTGDSDIEEVELGIVLDTKQLYIYKMIGVNEVITVLTITNYETNINLKANTFTFDESEWDGFYINK